MQTKEHTQRTKNVPDLKYMVSDNRLLGVWRLLRGFRWPYFGALVAVAVNALARAWRYQVLRTVVDEALEAGRTELLPWAALGFVGLAVVGGATAYLRGVWATRTAEGITRRLRDYLYDHIQRLPFSFHDHARTGELIQRVTSDVDRLRRFYADQAIGIGRVVALFIINFTMLMQMSVKLGLLSIVMLPLIVGLSYYFFGLVSKAYERYQQQEARLSTVLQENLSGVRVVRAFARQAHEIEKFDRENWEKYQRGKRLLVMHSLYWPLSDTLCTAQTLLVMAASAWMAMRGEISLGTAIAAANLATWIVWPIRNLGRLIVNVSTGLVSYRRVADIVRQEREDIEAGSVPMDTVIRGEVAFEHVNFAYEPKYDLFGSNGKGGSEVEEPGESVPVLHDITFHCKPADVVALVGATGSGKTSIVNLLLRFYDYQSGHIWLDGVELKAYPKALLRRQIGIVEQEPFLFSRSIRENITYGVEREVTQEEVEAAAKAAAIHDVILTFPDGYDTLVGEKGVTLSGGQRQRVAIARALLKNPRMLVLDDATSSVDTETEALIRQAMQRLMRGRTTFIIAHRIQTVMQADLILVLEQGRIVQAGTHEMLLRQEGPYRRIYEIQSRIEEEVQAEVAEAPASPAGQYP